MGNYGFKVTKDGKSTTSTAVEDYVFSSAYSTVKIIKEIESTQVVGAGASVSIIIRHDLGFVPVVMLYYEATPGSGRWFMGIPYAPDEDVSVDASQTGVTNIKFIFTLYNHAAASRTVKYHAYIFGDPV